jgi:hypothetical protein
VLPSAFACREQGKSMGAVSGQDRMPENKIGADHGEERAWGEAKLENRGQKLEIGREKRDSSPPQADPFTGVKGEEKVGLLRSE